MRGVSVDVRSPVAGKAKDALGNAVETWGEPVTVDDVLVAAGAAVDSLESNRPQGIVVSYTLTFPKSFTASLRGCQVRVPGDANWYDVVGDPKATPDGQLMRSFSRNRIVEVTRSDG